jgi:hypothetical protein
MPYRAYAHGQSVQAVTDDYKPSGDDKIFNHLPNEDELAKAFSLYRGMKSAEKLKENARAKFEELSYRGCQIKSKKTPKLDGTYSLRLPDMIWLIAVAAGVPLTGELPGGNATFSYADQDGNPHDFDRSNFANLYAALLDYYCDIKAGKSPPQPFEIP